MTGYREWRPAGPVGGLLECAWQDRTGPDGPREQRVLPDGCMDLLLLDGRLVVAGPDTAAHTATSEPGMVTTGLRFRPGALPALLGVPADELRDRRTDLAEVLGSDVFGRGVPGPGALSRGVPRDAPAGPVRPDLGIKRRVEPAAPGRGVAGTHAEMHGSGPDGLRDPCGAHLGAETLLDVAARLAAAAADRRGPLSGPLPHWVLRTLAGGAATADVADRLGVTTRTLHRTCTATLGYGPSVVRRVLRFRTAAALLHAGQAPADVAARTGYADQPHLSREVRALAGVSPTTLAGRG